MRGPAILLVCAAALTMFAVVYAVNFEVQVVAMTLAAFVAVAAILLLHDNLSGEG